MSDSQLESFLEVRVECPHPNGRGPGEEEEVEEEEKVEEKVAKDEEVEKNKGIIDAKTCMKIMNLTLVTVLFELR